MLEALEIRQEARLLHHEEQRAAAAAAADTIASSETRERAIKDLETRKLVERPHRVEAEIFIDGKIVDERRELGVSEEKQIMAEYVTLIHLLKRFNNHF